MRHRHGVRRRALRPDRPDRQRRLHHHHRAARASSTRSSRRSSSRTRTRSATSTRARRRRSRSASRRSAAAPTDEPRIFWRSHERGGNGGSRPIIDFLGDAEGTAEWRRRLSDSLDDGAPSTPASSAATSRSSDGTGAGQIRLIGSADAHRARRGSAPGRRRPTRPPSTSPRAPGQPITAVAVDSAVWLEESTAVLGFSRPPARARTSSTCARRCASSRARTTSRPPTTGPGTAIGSDLGSGNIAYYSTRLRAPPRRARRSCCRSTAAVRTRCVTAARDASTPRARATLRAPGAFAGLDLRPPAEELPLPVPGPPGPRVHRHRSRAAPGAKQTRRIAANDADVLQLEEPWGVVPGAGRHLRGAGDRRDAGGDQPGRGLPRQLEQQGGDAPTTATASAATTAIAFILERLAADDRVGSRASSASSTRTWPGSTAGRASAATWCRGCARRSTRVGNGGVPEVDACSRRSRPSRARPCFGRRFVDPVEDTTDRRRGARS